jgi:hypothetical protein
LWASWLCGGTIPDQALTAVHAIALMVKAPFERQTPMPLLDQIREKALIELAKTRFAAVLTEAELKVLRNSANSEDLPIPYEKAPRPEVRASFLRWLATDPEAAPHIDPEGLRVFAATIPGELDLRECRVNPTLTFHRCDFQGEIYLLSAETRGLYFLDSSLAKGIAADRVIVHGLLFLKNIQSEGEIRLLGAEIDGALNCTGAKLKAKENSLIADGARIRGGVFLTGNSEFKGRIRLTSAEIGGTLVIRGAKIAEVVGLNTIVTGDLVWQRIGNPGEARLDLRGAKIRNLRDDMESWPNRGKLDIDGMVYEELTLHGSSSEKNVKDGRYPPELPLDARERITWILLQGEQRCLEPQPWMQLRDLLERKGDRKGAKYVPFRFRCLQAKQKLFTPLLWLKGLILFVWKATKYLIRNPQKAFRRLWPYFRHPNRSFAIAFAWLEENPLRILWSIALTLLIGTSIFTWGGSKQAMIETVRLQPNMIRSYEETKDNLPNKPVSDHYPHFQPFVYTLENAVPLIKLGMDEKWAPDPRPEFCQPWFPRLPWLYFVSTYGWLNFWRWALIVWGWAQATILAASLVDRFKK